MYKFASSVKTFFTSSYFHKSLVASAVTSAILAGILLPLQTSAYSGAVIINTGISEPVRFYTTSHSLGTCNGSTWPSNANFTISSGSKTCEGDKFGPLNLYLASTPAGYVFTGFTTGYASSGVTTFSCGSNCQTISFTGARSLTLKANFVKAPSSNPTPVVVAPTPPQAPIPTTPVPTASSPIDSAVVINVEGYNGVTRFHTTGHSFGNCSSVSNLNFSLSNSGTCTGAQFGTPIPGNLANGLNLYLSTVPAGYQFNGFSITYAQGDARSTTCNASSCYMNFASGSVSLKVKFTKIVASTVSASTPAAPASTPAPASTSTPTSTPTTSTASTTATATTSTTPASTAAATPVVVASRTTTTTTPAAATTTSATRRVVGKLANTGPSEVVSIFTATSIGAGAAHRVVTARRKRLFY